MAVRLHFLGCVMTLAAMLAPWAAVVQTAVHLAFDAHHHEQVPAAHDDLHDASAALHGHEHEHGTPAHGHDATPVMASSQVTAPGLTSHPSATTFASAALVPDVAFPARLDPSPPLRAPIILRV